MVEVNCHDLLQLIWRREESVPIFQRHEGGKHWGKVHQVLRKEHIRGDTMRKWNHPKSNPPSKRSRIQDNPKDHNRSTQRSICFNLLGLKDLPINCNHRTACLKVSGSPDENS